MSEFTISVFADEIDARLETQMDVLEEYGISFIELRGVNGRNITQHSLSEVREIKKRLDERGFRISAVGSPLGKIGIADDFEPHLELFRHTVDIAGILDTPYIRLFSFFMPQGEDPVRYREEVMRRMKAFVSIAEERNVYLLHENEKDIYGDTPDRCADLFRSLDSAHFRGIFDPANYVQCNVSTYPDAYEQVADYTVHVHIKDALYSDHSVVPAGSGDGKVKQLLTALHRRDYRGFLTIEPHLALFEGFSELESRTDTLDKPQGYTHFVVALQALRQLLGEIAGQAQRNDDDASSSIRTGGIQR